MKKESFLFGWGTFEHEIGEHLSGLKSNVECLITKELQEIVSI